MTSSSETRPPGAASDAVSHLYFHAPCFDGIVSAVLTWEYLESEHGWSRIELHPVNYHLRDRWLNMDLGARAAVVDFLYSPRTFFWADHHLSSFLNDDVRRDFETARGRILMYDDQAPSCAGLLWRGLHQRFGHQTKRFREIVYWAEKIDSASYTSPEEALFPRSPAVMISASLAIGIGGDAYCEGLVCALKRSSIEETAALPEVRRRADEFIRLGRAGLERLKKTARLEDDIVLFDVDTTDVLVSRYAPYHLFPDARYSAGILRFPGGAKITAMRNPWIDFESVPIGRICEELGGGGHRRVGSIALSAESVGRASSLLQRLVAEMRQHEAARAALR